MAKSSYKPELGNEAPALNEDEVPKTIRLSIPPELYAEYAEAATKQGLTVTELIMHRLTRCKDHGGIRTLFFNDSNRAQLESLCQKRPIETADQALGILTACLSIRVNDFEPVALTAQQVKRLGMSGYASQTPQDRLAQIIRGAVSKAVGI